MKPCLPVSTFPSLDSAKLQPCPNPPKRSARTNQAAVATTPRCSPPANTPLARPMPPCPRAHATAERTQPLPLRPHPGHSQDGGEAWSKLGTTSTTLGTKQWLYHGHWRAGRGVSFLSRRAWGGCFFYFFFFGGFAFSLVNQKCQQDCSQKKDLKR